jgi:succinyl-diaminopimelate desuccinylase
VTDLLASTAELVDIPSVSHDEAAITGVIEQRLRSLGHLVVDRVGDNVVARTQLGRDRRVILGGHTDTVPVNGNGRARVDGDVLWGVGSADMKSGLAVMLQLAADLTDPAVDVTYVFYAGEEVALEFNGLRHLLAERPELLRGDVAILGEPTGGRVEAGCQGTLRLEVTVLGERAHTARPWMGRNAIHRLGEVLARVAAYQERRPVLDSCEYREALQAVRVEGGVANNVVPDRATLTLNHRFAPDRDVEQAVAHVRSVIGEVDDVQLTDAATPAPPGLTDPLLAALVARTGHPARAKLGWTDVSFFAAHGVPATNYGPGDPTLAHTADERVGRAEIEQAYRVLRSLLTTPAG